MIYQLSYKTCARCHGTGRAITGSHTTRDGAEPIYKKCWECDNGYGMTITKNRSTRRGGAGFEILSPK